MRGMRAVARKELRQLLRDHRTLALLIVQPLLLLLVFGYAASFDVSEVRAIVVGPGAAAAAEQLPPILRAVEVDPAGDRADALERLRAGDVVAAVVAAGPRVDVLVDGSQLFAARALTAGLAQAGAPARIEVLFNPGLETPPVLVPALAGIVLAFVATIATSLGIVRERQAGTMEQLAVMPLRPAAVLVGKVLPYLVVALIDLVVVVAAGYFVFDVPFVGSLPLFSLGALLFLVVALGFGLLVSSVSENQGQAMQLALMTTLPQVLLSGAIFPLESMAAVPRAIGYLLPLTWFIQVARGVMLRDATLSDLALPLAVLAVLAVTVFAVAIVRVRRDLVPARVRAAVPAQAPA